MRLRNGLPHIAHTIEVVVDPGEQHRSRRRARCADMKVRKAHTRLRQLVQVGCLNFTAKCTNVTEAPVVCQHQDNVRSFGPGGCANQKCGAGANGQPDLKGTAFGCHDSVRGRQVKSIVQCFFNDPESVLTPDGCVFIFEGGNTP